ncbi:MAG TPA: metal ABC transporter permease [Candidatus Dormibacteraeota bacterium]|jgi:zinc/manganese transport system permease protein|nr:metal ABC transporter permease [Candidatus Dormibacteraeota bacterium]
MLEFLWLPLLACLILTAIHVYLGLHVLARGVIFVDLALAQVAALGISVAFLAGHPIQSDAAYWYALAFTVGGAGLFSLSRVHRAPIPQEAVIGIVYAVSAAAAVLVVDRAPQGGEHIKTLLVGSILTVSGGEVVELALLYGLIGALHLAVHRPLLEISFDPDRARAHGRRLRGWDFLFYVTFGIVVTSSVRIAGVLLVFSYLIVPAAVAALLTASVPRRLLIGWSVGALVSAGGLWASFAWDLPTGATVVTAFGGLMALVAAALGVRAVAGHVRERGWAALRGIGALLCAAMALAGLSLAILPGMDHFWLDWIEAAAPPVRLTFLTPTERAVYRDSREAMDRDAAELARLRGVQQDVQWGARQMPAEQQERLRQFLAGRGEIVAGDRMVLATLRAHARTRQRFWLGVPLLVLGVLGAGWLGAPRPPAGVRPG